jgi:hypothetical protein
MDANQWPGFGVREIQSALLAVAEGEPGKIDSVRLEQWLRENSGVEAVNSRCAMTVWTITAHHAGR